ncbi:MAG: hypothetical protein AB7F22_07770 [Reyranella sp.]|uniref:hypothetical protein n=1 Tax=Reyranella sp. TaxID=1929291 RepID=UPI003D11D212
MTNEHLSALWAVAKRAEEYEDRWLDLLVTVELCHRCKAVRLEAFHDGRSAGLLVSWEEFLASNVPELMLFDQLDQVIQVLFGPAPGEAVN